MGNNNPSIDEEQVDNTDHASNPYDEIDRKEKVNIIKKLVNELPEKQRSCMQLRDFEGKSYKEIAEILAITEEQVKVNIFRARQAIKKRFQEFDKYGL
jgi:RNA polymerase sigma-70 factor (ECF subfamily)